MRIKQLCLFVFSISIMLISSLSFAAINRVRVVNNTKSEIFIHVGGFAPSVRIAPGQWKLFYYPFNVVPPGYDKKITTGLLVATAGGQWITTPNGYTYLHKPNMELCINYASKQNLEKSGNRVWSINKTDITESGCKIKGYKQVWYQKQS